MNITIYYFARTIMMIREFILSFIQYLFDINILVVFYIFTFINKIVKILNLSILTLHHLSPNLFVFEREGRT